jgi:hypothetical protein
MKKLLGIVVLGLLWCNIALSKDLSDNRILCDWFTKKTLIGIEFKDKINGSYYEIKKEESWYIEKIEFTYKVFPEYIRMDGKNDKYIPFSLVRKNLKLNNKFKCDFLRKSSTVSMDETMDIAMDELRKKNESENKL